MRRQRCCRRSFIVLDTVAPTSTASITSVADNWGASTGNVANNGTTDDPTLLLSGTFTGALEAGDHVVIYDGITVLGNATVTGTDWTFNTPELPYSANAGTAHHFAAYVQDSLGNNSTASNIHHVNLIPPGPAVAQGLAGATNIDVRSDIVLSTGEAVDFSAGTFTITLTNTAETATKAGFQTDGVNHTQTITIVDGVVTGGGAVTFSADHTKIIINPTFDLDLSNNYTLSISPGAFTGHNSHNALPDFASVSFSTVTPTTLASYLATPVAAAQARQMDHTTGTLVDSLQWLDVTNPSDDDPSQTADQPYHIFNAAAQNFAFVVKDMNPGSEIGLESGISVTDTFIHFNGFGADDLLYLDNQDQDTTVQATINKLVFEAGRGIDADPYRWSAEGTSVASAFEFVLDPSIVVPVYQAPILPNVLLTNWSHTGMVIAG